MPNGISRRKELPLLTLSSDELNLVQAIEEGKSIDFGTTLKHHDRESMTVIRSQVLIDVVRGKHISLPDGNNRPVVVRSCGIRVSRARVTGILDLQDAS